MVKRQRQRVCNATCHNAKGKTCRCFCGGLFHGVNNIEAREQYVAAFGKLPRTQAEFDKAMQQPDLFDEPSTIATRETLRKANDENF